MVARPIHNLKVAGSNLEGGNIFSERYLARKVCEERKRKMESVAELQRRKEYGKKQTFLKCFFKISNQKPENLLLKVVDIMPLCCNLICKSYEY